MKLPSRALIVLAIPFCVVTLSQRANAQVKPESKTADATVSGKVTIKGKPAAGIVVGMRLSRPDELSSTYKARTDQEGVYRISRVAGGNYLVAPVTPAFVIADSYLGAPGQSVVITESENIEGINFDLVPGGVITGKVTDSEGKPLIEERVSLMPADEADQRRPFYYGSASGMTTDDRGVYRIFGLPAGRYRVSVGDPRFNPGNRRRATVQTFYPDVTDLAKAGIVEVKEGSEANKIDITIGEAPQGYSVAGRVVDAESGAPIANVYIQLTRIETTGSNTRGMETADVQTNTQGQFRLTNVRSGKYDLNMYAPDESNARTDGPLRFDVLDQDVTGLVIKTTTGATVAGTVVFEGSKSNPTTLPPQMWIMIQTRSDANSGSGMSKSARVRPDGTFVAGGLTAGIVNFNVETMNSKGFNLVRVERDGVPQPNGIQIQNGEQVSGLRLVMTFSNGSIRGVVRIENGTLPPNARINVQITKAGEQGQFARGVEVDTRGHFLIEGLAAGTYELRAVAYSPEMQRQRVRPPMSAKQIVIVNEGAAADVTLTLDLTPPPIQ